MEGRKLQSAALFFTIFSAMLLLPPLVLHDRGGGKHTAEAEAVLRGEAALPF